MNPVSLTIMKSASRGAARLRRVLSACLSVFLIGLSLYAQGNAGRILGTISEQSGAGIPGAIVTA